MQTNAIFPLNIDKPATARKRPVNLTLNEGLVAEAKTYTGNLSATLEGLLADYVVGQKQARYRRNQLAQALCADWNAVNDAIGSFAEEHSTL